MVINSTKSMIGHLLGAAGGVEFITCVKSMEDGFIHQTVGTKEADEECDLNYAIGSPVEKEIKAAMSNSLGFGGHNATILIQKYEENGIKLQLNKKENLVMGTTAPMQAVTPEDVKVTGASSKAATDLEEGVQKQTGTSEAAPVGNVVKAPLVGTFYAAPAEDAEPFIQVGDSVKKGQSVAIIEAMKLMNEIESDFDGTVTEILVKNGQAVEYGQPLFRIA